MKRTSRSRTPALSSSHLAHVRGGAAKKGTTTTTTTTTTSRPAGGQDGGLGEFIGD